MISNSGDTSNQTLVITLDKENPATITFTNRNDGTDTSGYGILNTYTFDGVKWSFERADTAAEGTD